MAFAGLDPDFVQLTGANVAITSGPDGNVWFAESSKIGRITPNGAVSEFATPTANVSIVGMTSGPNGNVWFTESSIGANNVAEITPTGFISEYALPGILQGPAGITTGADGHLWVAESFGNEIVQAIPLASVPVACPVSLPAIGTPTGWTVSACP